MFTRPAYPPSCTLFPCLHVRSPTAVPSAWAKKRERSTRTLVRETGRGAASSEFHFLHGPLIPQRPEFAPALPEPPLVRRDNRAGQHATRVPTRQPPSSVPCTTNSATPHRYTASKVCSVSPLSVCSSSHPPAPPATYYGRELVPPPSPLLCARASPPTVLPSAILNSLPNSPPPPSSIFFRSRPCPHGPLDVSLQNTTETP